MIVGHVEVEPMDAEVLMRVIWERFQDEPGPPAMVDYDSEGGGPAEVVDEKRREDLTDEEVWRAFRYESVLPLTPEAARYYWPRIVEFAIRGPRPSSAGGRPWWQLWPPRPKWQDPACREDSREEILLGLLWVLANDDEECTSGFSPSQKETIIWLLDYIRQREWPVVVRDLLEDKYCQAATRWAREAGHRERHKGGD